MPAPLPARPWCFPPAQEHRLSTGLRVLTCPLPGQHLVSVELALRIPLNAEPAGLDGITTTLAAVFRSGQPTCELERRVGPGLAINADPQGIRLRMTCPPDALHEVIALLGAVVRRPRLDADHVTALVHGRAKAGRRTSGDPGGTEGGELHAALFGRTHRLGRPWHGAPSTLKHVGSAELRAFHGRWVRPDRAVLVVAGPPSALAHQRIAAAFGRWGGDDTALVCPPPPPAVDAPHDRLVLVERPEYEQVQVMLGAIVPGPGDPDWPALLSILYLAGGAQLALLDTALRERHGYTFGIRASTRPVPGSAVAVIRGFMAAEHAAAAYARLLGIIGELQEAGCSQSERDRAIRSLRDAAPRHLQTSKAVSGALAEVAIRGLSHRYPSWLHRALADVSVENMRDALATHLAPGRLVSVISGPPRAIGQVADAAADG